MLNFIRAFLTRLTRNISNVLLKTGAGCNGSGVYHYVEMCRETSPEQSVWSGAGTEDLAIFHSFSSTPDRKSKSL